MGLEWGATCTRPKEDARTSGALGTGRRSSPSKWQICVIVRLRTSGALDRRLVGAVVAVHHGPPAGRRRGAPLDHLDAVETRGHAADHHVDHLALLPHFFGLLV